MKRVKKNSNFHQSKKAFYIMLVVSAIGALSWVPFLWELFKTVDINIKTLEFYEYVKLDNSPENQDKAHPNYDSKNYLLKLSVVVLNKDFDLKEIQCEGYDSSNKKVKISVESWETLYYFDSKGTGNIQSTLILQKNEYLNSNASFKKNENYTGFIGLTTAIPMKQLATIKIRFISFSDHVVVKELKIKEINNAKKADPLFI